MTNRIQTGRASAVLRLAVVGGLATATLAGSLAWPAHAEQRDDHGGNRNEARHAPPRQPEHARNVRRHDDDRGPDVYYTAPPIVYESPAYARQPAAAMTFIFPSYR